MPPPCVFLALERSCVTVPFPRVTVRFKWDNVRARSSLSAQWVLIMS